MEEILKKMVWILFIIGILYSIIATYMRVFENGDYVIMYRVPCNPATEICFSEETCDESSNQCETNYYSSIQRTKSNLESICGTDISTCALAEKCMDGEVNCLITFCNPKEETCSDNTTSNE